MFLLSKNNFLYKKHALSKMSNCEINLQAGINNVSVKSPVKRRKEARKHELLKFYQLSNS